MALEILWSWAKELQINPHELLLAQNEEGKNSWILAAEKGKGEILEKMWVWAKEVQLNSRKTKKNILLAKDKYGYTAWHRAAEKGRLEALEIIWSLCKEAKIKKHELWQAHTEGGYTAYQMAVKNNHEGTINKLLIWGRESHINPKEFRKYFFTPEKKYNCIGCDQPAERDSLEALDILQSWAKEAEINTDKSLLTQTGEGEISFKLAEEKNFIQTLKKMWDWAEEKQMNTKKLKKSLFLAKSKNGYTAWHRAAEGGQLGLLDTLWIWSKEVEINTDELLLAKTGKQYTAFHLAAKKTM
jgi:ankyrin repeat protein